MARERHRWDPRCDPPDDLVHPVRVDPTGSSGPTPGQARGPGWRKVSHGFYVPSWVSDDLPEQRIAEQAARLREGGAVTGWASLRLHGASFFDGLEPDGRTRMAVALNPGHGHQLEDRPGGTVTRDRLYGTETTRRQGVPCTTVPRALFDEMRAARDLRAAVVAMDMAAAAELVSVARMTAYTGLHPGWTGVEQVRHALPLASEDSASPRETQMRLVWVLDAGLPPPLCNQPLFSRAGRLVGYPDLLDVEAGVVGEFDGAEHRGMLRHTRDVAREDRFRRLGLEYFKITGLDLADPSLVVDRMRTTRQRARFEPVTARRWTIEQPSWWQPEPSLDARLEEREWNEELRKQWEREPQPDVRELRGW